MYHLLGIEKNLTSGKKEITYDFLATVLLGDKKVSKTIGNYPIKHINLWKFFRISVQMWEKLRVKDIICFAKISIEEYIPEYNK